VFAEIFRVLKPGGVCIVTFSNRLFYDKARAASCKQIGQRAQATAAGSSLATSCSDVACRAALGVGRRCHLLIWRPLYVVWCIPRKEAGRELRTWPAYEAGVVLSKPL